MPKTDCQQGCSHKGDSTITEHLGAQPKSCGYRQSTQKSRRQAQGLYNRYFNIKFVSLAGDYNTCSQTCPVRTQVLGDMRGELLDKELGLMKISGDSAGYYRADHLLKESQLVLEATCRACDAGSTR